MELYVLDKNFQNVFIIDEYESILWTDRYCGYGDVEIYSAVTQALLTNTPQDYYLWSRDSEHLMIIEETTITTDSETGSHLRIVGRSLESLLDRRIIWNQTTLSGSLQNGIKKLINENVINPSISQRKISNFVWKDSTDSRITALTVDKQLTGDNLYDAIVEICSEVEIGFKVTLNSANQFVFQLYMGDDRSYEQTANPFVIFSPSFENIINSNYFENKALLKNVALVAGEDQAQNRKTTTIGTTSGLDRRELYVDARDIQTEVDGEVLSETEYTNLLKSRGNEKLAENIHIKTFEGEVDTTQMYVYGRDFFVGDVVEIVNEYGHQGRTRVEEIVFSNDTRNGSKAVPTFVMLDNEE